jgi:Uncharacterized lipoprotein
VRLGAFKAACAASLNSLASLHFLAYQNPKAFKPQTKGFHMGLFRILKFILPLLALSLTGCHTYTFTVRNSALPQPLDTRSGNLQVKLIDRREDKTRIGEVRNGFRSKLGDIVTSQELEVALAECFKQTLEKAGYQVTPEAKVTLECEIREFKVYENGWTQGAKQVMRFRLRDKQGSILWEKSFTGQDGGMVVGVSSIEKSMNVALTRLLKDALEEFASEFFYQQLCKGGAPETSEKK